MQIGEIFWLAASWHVKLPGAHTINIYNEEEITNLNSSDSGAQGGLSRFNRTRSRTSKMTIKTYSAPSTSEFHQSKKQNKNKFTPPSQKNCLHTNRNMNVNNIIDILALCKNYVSSARRVQKIKIYFHLSQSSRSTELNTKSEGLLTRLWITFATGARCPLGSHAILHSLACACEMHTIYLRTEARILN